MKKVIYFALLGLLGFWAISCDEDDDATPAPPTEAEKQAYVQFIIEEQLVMQEIGSFGTLFGDLFFNPGGRVSDCGNVSYSGDNNSGTITIDYGSGCTDEDGQVLKGKVIYTYSATNNNQSINVSITFVNFSADGNTIEGKVENTFAINTFISTTKVSNLKVKSTDGKSWTISTSTQVLKQTAGLDTQLDPEDDEYSYNIASSGTGINGISYTTKTTKDLLIKSSCLFSEDAMPHAVSGTIEIKPTNFPTYIIDYGNGACDNKITVKIGDAAPVEYTLGE
jgi:hypothetical protein